MAALSVLIGALNATNLANVTSSLNESDLAGISPLSFVSPTADLTTFNKSQQINVTWTTPFDFTTVEVFQGPLEDDSYVSDIIAANFTRNMTSLWYEAGAVQNANLSYPIHFRLQKGHQPNDCEACILDSIDVKVMDPSVTSTTSSSTSMASTTATSMSPAAAEATSEAPARTSSDSDSRDVRLGVGIGVGLGLGFLILILGAMFLILRHRKQKRNTLAMERDLEERRHLEAAEVEKQRYSSGTESWMSGMTHKQFEFEGPNGTLREGWESLFGGVDGLRGFLTRKPSPRKNQARKPLPLR